MVRRLLPFGVATAATITGIVLLVINSVVLDEPGPSSALPRVYLAVWPAGLVLLGVGALGVIGACLFEAIRDDLRD